MYVYVCMCVEGTTWEIYMYVCMYACICLYMHECVGKGPSGKCIYMCVYIHFPDVHVHMCTCMFMCIHVYTCMHVCEGDHLGESFLSSHLVGVSLAVSSSPLVCLPIMISVSCVSMNFFVLCLRILVPIDTAPCSKSGPYS